MKQQDTIELGPPMSPLRGPVCLPGSKSITNRAVLLAALANGESELHGVLESDDTRYMSAALKALGVRIARHDARHWSVSGTGRLHPPAETLFLGNAGTATRFLTAAAALVDGRVIITGDEHMQRRPVAPLLDALSQLGIDAHAPTGCPPVTIWGRGRFAAERIAIDGRLSSQYVSAVLMIAPMGQEPLQVTISGPTIGARGYIELTLAAMRAFGADVQTLSDGNWCIQPSGYRAIRFDIEPDASAATYLWAAERLTHGSIDLGVCPANMTQPDARAYDLIQRFPRLPDRIDGSQMQDAVPTLAVLAAFNDTPVRFIGIENLRVKECDRIRALATEISKLGSNLITEKGDELHVSGRTALAPTARVIFDTWSDHRIAMSLSLAGLVLPGIAISDPGCVAKTYPRYWRDLASLGVSIRRGSDQSPVSA